MNRRQKQQASVIAGGIALTIITVAIGYAAYKSMDDATADKSGCFAGIPAPNTVFMIDASPPKWDREQARGFMNFIDDVYASLVFNQRVAFYTTEGDAMAPYVEPRFHVCGTAATSGELEAAGAAPAADAFLVRQKRALFERTLKPELDAVFAENTDQARRQEFQSPLLEMNKAIFVAEKLKPGDHYVVLSDGVANSETARFCAVQNDMPPFEAFQQRHTYQDRLQLQPRSLEGVRVTFLMLIRDGYGEFCPGGEEEIREWWRQYYTYYGATVEFIRMRPGVGL